jgi:GNAT superfamily N-acetyltransferase
MEIALQKPRGMNDWLRLNRLYADAFPRAERKPFSRIRQMFREGKADVWCILKDGRFTGLATTVNSDDLILIDYFAVSKRMRGRGIGRTAMECLLSMYEDKGVFLEIESTDRPGLDREQRIRRKEFYCSCGFADLAVKAKVFGVYMELLGIRCQLDFDGYRAFYRDHYSGWAADHLEEVK